MANRKTTRRLTAAEIEERNQERSETRTRTWQRVAFIAVSVIVLLSMVITLFIR
jgi:hypothetical protein